MNFIFRLFVILLIFRLLYLPVILLRFRIYLLLGLFLTLAINHSVLPFPSSTSIETAVPRATTLTSTTLVYYSCYHYCCCYHRYCGRTIEKKIINTFRYFRGSCLAYFERSERDPDFRSHLVTEPLRLAGDLISGSSSRTGTWP